MTPPLEQDYIGLADPRTPPKLEEEVSMGRSMRETELRLGPPGSLDLREERPLLTLGLLTKGHVAGKRGFSDAIDGNEKWVLSGRAGGEGEMKKGGVLGVKVDAVVQEKKGGGAPPAAKAQVVGWPPIRNHRKNTMAAHQSKNTDDAEEKQGSSCLYIKVSMDGAPYLRKVDLRMYYNYKELSLALEKMFSCFTIGQCSRGPPSKEGLGESRLNDVHGSEYVLTYEDRDGDWMLVGDVPWDMFTDTCKRMRIMKGSEAIGLAPRAAEKCKG